MFIVLANSTKCYLIVFFQQLNKEELSYLFGLAYVGTWGLRKLEGAMERQTYL